MHLDGLAATLRDLPARERTAAPARRGVSAPQRASGADDFATGSDSVVSLRE